MVSSVVCLPVLSVVRGSRRIIFQVVEFGEPQRVTVSGSRVSAASAGRQDATWRRVRGRAVDISDDLK